MPRGVFPGQRDCPKCNGQTNTGHAGRADAIRDKPGSGGKQCYPALCPTDRARIDLTPDQGAIPRYIVFRLTPWGASTTQRVGWLGSSAG